MAGSERPILVGIDGSSSALRALRWAAREAMRREAPVHLVLGRPLPHGSRFERALVPDEHNALLSTGREMLADAERELLRVAPEVTVTSELRVAAPEAVLVRASREAQLLVLGSRGLGGFTGLLVGSVAVAAAAHADCPVIVVRGDEDEDVAEAARPVVVGVDGTSLSDAAVEFACDLASSRGAALTALHVRDGDFDGDWPGQARDQAEDRARREMSDQLGAWRDKYPDVAVRTAVRTGRPAPVLIDESKTAQLVVVGSRGRGGLAGLTLGSVSHALLHHSHCPVAIVRAAAAIVADDLEDPQSPE